MNKQTTHLHIYNDLGISKNAIKKEITECLDRISDNEANERGLTQASELINKRTQIYTLDEAECLIAWYISAHDECAVENPEDFHPLQVYKATEKIARYNSAHKKITNLKQIIL